MAHLVFQGHKTRGKELHKLLENLGGVDCGYAQCGYITCYYYINREGFIEGSNAIPLYMDKRVIMTLEEFEQKYPYKVGDKVNYVKYNDGYPSVYTIQRMRWTGVTIEYLLDSSGFSAFTKDLQPYKEDIMGKASKVVFDANAQCCDISNKIIKKETMGKEISGAIVDRFICLEGYDFYDDKGNIIDTKEITMKKKKPKYPKIYKECCKVLQMPKDESYIDIDVPLSYNKVLKAFTQLLICRDAYWKIAGNWKPNWEDTSQIKHSIWFNNEGICIKSNRYSYAVQHILTFPTEEMRYAFYENFNELIEECKELL